MFANDSFAVGTACTPNDRTWPTPGRPGANRTGGHGDGPAAQRRLEGRALPNWSMSRSPGPTNAATVIEGSVTELNRPGTGILGSELSRRPVVDQFGLLPRHAQRAADVADARSGLGHE